MKQAWEKIVARPETVLHWDACVSFRRQGVQLDPIEWGTRNDLVIKNNDPIGVWYGSNPPLEEQTNLGQLINDVNLPVEQALDKAIQIIDEDLLALPGTSLKDAEELYYRFRTDMGLMVFGFSCSAVPASKLQEVIGNDRFEKNKELLLRPHRPTLIGRESRAIYNIQKEMKDHERDWLENQAQKLAEEFGYIHSDYIAQSWTKDDYLKTLQNDVMIIDDTSLLDLSQFTEYEQWLVNITQKLSYLHDEGKTALIRTNWALRETLKNIGHTDQILLLNEEEFLQWTHGGELPSPEELEKRENYYAILSEDERYEFYFGKEAVGKVVKDAGLELEKSERRDQLSGQTAFKGKAIGKIRIIYTQEDSKNLQEGEILVTSMTTPAYIDAMRKAAAFVTDEGGALCHAAIVAREFKKPCVVGTKTATTNFKDGDLVEVDAEQGIVRIIT